MPTGSELTGDVQGFPWKVRRMVDNLSSFVERGTTASYPKTTDALDSLRRAVAEELPTQRKRQATHTTKQHKSSMVGVASRKHYQRCLRLEKQNAELRAKVASLTEAKSGHTLSTEWIVRVCLATPSSNGRNMAKSFREVVGSTPPPSAEPAFPESGTLGLRCSNPW